MGAGRASSPDSLSSFRTAITRIPAAYVPRCDTTRLGAGWYELEHDSLGFEFGTFTDRFARLQESLKIIIGMLRGEQPTVDGTWSRSSAPNCWRAASTA
jgi:hypothetical protein